jgi:hypothetical protein
VRSPPPSCVCVLVHLTSFGQIASRDAFPPADQTKHAQDVLCPLQVSPLRCTCKCEKTIMMMMMMMGMVMVMVMAISDASGLAFDQSSQSNRSLICLWQSTAYDGWSCLFCSRAWLTLRDGCATFIFTRSLLPCSPAHSCTTTLANLSTTPQICCLR